MCARENQIINIFLAWIQYIVVINQSYPSLDTVKIEAPRITVGFQSARTHRISPYPIIIERDKSHHQSRRNAGWSQSLCSLGCNCSTVFIWHSQQRSSPLCVRFLPADSPHIIMIKICALPVSWHFFGWAGWWQQGPELKPKISLRREKFADVRWFPQIEDIDGENLFPAHGGKPTAVLQPIAIGNKQISCLLPPMRSGGPAERPEYRNHTDVFASCRVANIDRLRQQYVCPDSDILNRLLLRWDSALRLIE